MRKYSPIISVCLLMVATSLSAASVVIKEQKEVICECLGAYTRISFEVADGWLTNVKVVNSSSNPKCDKWHIRSLISSTTALHPNGVTGTGVVGASAKDKTMSYNQCLKTDEIEIDNYWFAEEFLIDIEKINRK